MDRTRQAQASKTSQANTTQHYSTHSSVGTRMPARKLAPLDLVNMPTDAWAGSLISKRMQECIKIITIIIIMTVYYYYYYYLNIL
jgi:hypothetical protein